MNRNLILGLLAAVLVIALFWFLLYSPKNDEIAELREQTDQIQQQQLTVQSRITTLKGVREDAPELEALLAATESVVPRTPGLPAALRQLQQAADDSGVELLSVSPGRPAAVGGEDVTPGLSTMSLALQLNAGYFQLVDFLRRVEDPAITPRAILWQSVVLGESEYPTLTASVTGQMYVVLPVTAPVEPEPTEAPTDGGTETPAPADTEADAA